MRFASLHVDGKLESVEDPDVVVALQGGFLQARRAAGSRVARQDGEFHRRSFLGFGDRWAPLPPTAHHAPGPAATGRPSFEPRVGFLEADCYSVAMCSTASPRWTTAVRRSPITM